MLREFNKASVTPSVATVVPFNVHLIVSAPYVAKRLAGVGPRVPPNICVLAARVALTVSVKLSTFELDTTTDSAFLTKLIDWYGLYLATDICDSFL